MPLTVITLKNAPNFLRGDLTKWMQEIARGVYVGNFNSKVREKLWIRIANNIGAGEATLSYHYRNEIGYKFETINTKMESVDCDGIPLVLVKKEEDESSFNNQKTGFSDASKFRKLKKFKNKISKNNKEDSFVVIDIETDGLDYIYDNILEVAALKVDCGEIKTYSSLIKIKKNLPEQIKKLTGINNDLLNKEGRELEIVLKEFVEFIGTNSIIGYNLDFDLLFINHSLKKLGLEKIVNKNYDLLKMIKKENNFLSSYKLDKVLKEYGIEEEQPHRALEDAKLTYKLATKVNGFLDLVNEK